MDQASRSCAGKEGRRGRYLRFNSTASIPWGMAAGDQSISLHIEEIDRSIVIASPLPAKGGKVRCECPTSADRLAARTPAIARLPAA